MAVSGVAEMAFMHRDGRVRLAGLEQRAPLRVLFPEDGDDTMASAVIATVGGGLLGGDELRIGVRVGPGGRAAVTGQAAEKIYRSAGAMTRIDIRLDTAAGGWLEWLPQETIVFNHARIERSTELSIEPGSQTLAGDILVFGRRASGETLTHGLIDDAWSVRVGGQLVWTDRFRIADDLARPLSRNACLAGAVAVATIAYVGEDAGALLALARSITRAEVAAPVRGGATVVGGVLVLRWLAWDALRLRQSFARAWTALRQRAGGRAPVMPRIWSV
jgi:urease accessory protein